MPSSNHAVCHSRYGKTDIRFPERNVPWPAPPSCFHSDKDGYSIAYAETVLASLHPLIEILTRSTCTFFAIFFFTSLFVCKKHIYGFIPKSLDRIDLTLIVIHIKEFRFEIGRPSFQTMKRLIQDLPTIIVMPVSLSSWLKNMYAMGISVRKNDAIRANT